MFDLWMSRVLWRKRRWIGTAFSNAVLHVSKLRQDLIGHKAFLVSIGGAKMTKTWNDRRDQRTLVVCYRVGSHFYGICWLLLFYYFQIFSLPLCLSSCYYCTTDFNDLISYSIKEEFKFGEISIQIFWSSGNWIELRERVSRWHRCRLFRYEYDDFSLTIRNGKEYRLFLAKWKLWCVALVRPAETVLSNWIQ